MEMKTRAIVLAFGLIALQSACSTAAVGGGSGPHPSASAAAGDSTSSPARSVPEMRDKLAKSRAAWSALLASKGPRYTYRRSFTSWTGHGFETTVVVDGSKVIERRYLERSRSTAGETSMGQTWVESGNAVGSHTEGHPAVTLDALYDECAAKLATIDLSTTLVYFDIGGDGLLRTCLTVEKGCADDCSRGVSIESVSLGNGT